MRFIGLLIFITGILAIILPLAGADFIYFSWADRWGQAASFGIRAGVALLGFLIWRFGPRR